MQFPVSVSSLKMTISFVVDISSMLCRIRSSTYIRTIPRLRNFGMLSRNVTLRKTQQVRNLLFLNLTYYTGIYLAQNKYAKVIGNLMYAMTCTRPDIAYAVGRLSMHTSSPGKEHWDAINRVFKYLKKTTDYGLEYSGDPSVLEGYTDASWITDQEDYASTSRWIFTLGGGAVFWGSEKQSCLTDSSMAAEFVALDESTLSRVYNQVYNGKSRHIGLRHGQLNQLINDGVITVSFLRSSKNLADPFTKGLPRKLIENTSQGMELKPIYGNSLDKVHLSECGSEAASYEFKGLALKHYEKPR
ncbi:hypothetical protein Tco_1153345 [Tanacetum coccineum]